MNIILTFIASQAKAMMIKCKLQYKVFKYTQHMISRLATAYQTIIEALQ